MLLKRDLGGRAKKTKVKGFEEVETGSRTTLLLLHDRLNQCEVINPLTVCLYSGKSASPLLLHT